MDEEMDILETRVRNLEELLLTDFEKNAQYLTDQYNLGKQVAAMSREYRFREQRIERLGPRGGGSKYKRSSNVYQLFENHQMFSSLLRKSNPDAPCTFKDVPPEVGEKRALLMRW